MRKFMLLFLVLALAVIAFVPAAAQDEATARIRVAHLSPDTPAVDVYINGELSDVQALEYPNITGWVEVPAGTYTIAVAPAGTSADDAAIGPADLTFSADTWTTIAAVGSLANGTLAPALFEEDYSNITPGNVRVGVFHAIEGAPAVNVLANGSPIITQLGYPGSLGSNDGFFELEVPAGTYDIQVQAANSGDVLIDLPGTSFDMNQSYLVAAIVRDGAPTVQVAANSVPGNSLFDVALTDDRFSTLVAAVLAADLGGALDSGGPFTVLAPSNGAFEAALNALGISAEDLLADTDTLTQILLYHVIDGAATSDVVAGLSSAPTLQGEEISIEVGNLGVVLNGTVNVVRTDITADNGVIHVINEVLLPPSIAEALGLSMAAPEEEMSEEAAGAPTIAEIAVGNENFSTLVTALQAAGLVDLFADPTAGPFTVFAPTNDAFAALPAGTLEAVLADPSGILTQILQYHVVEGAVTSDIVVTLSEATTLLGEPITIEVVDGGVVLNGSVNVVMVDIEASNGVIHVIDAVLLPPTE